MFETPRRRRRADGVHAVPDLPGPHAPRAGPRGAAAPGGGGGQRSATRSGGPTSSSTASSTRAAGCPASRPSRGRGPATSYSACVRPRAGRGGPLRLPALLAARQRPPLAHGSARTRSSTRSPTPTQPSASSSTRPAGSTPSSTTRRDPGRRPRPDRRRAAAAAGRGAGRGAGGCWRRTQSGPESAELAVSPTAARRAVYVLADGRRGARAHAGGARAPAGLDGVDLFAWLETRSAPGAAGAPTARRRRREAVVERAGRELRFRPGRRGPTGAAPAGTLEGELGGARGDRRATAASTSPPIRTRWRGCGRRWPPRTRARSLVSAEPRLRVRRLGRRHALPGRQPRRARAGDSLGPAGALRPRAGIEDAREQWALRDVAGLVLGHFGRRRRRAGAGGGSRPDGGRPVGGRS